MGGDQKNGAIENDQTYIQANIEQKKDNTNKIIILWRKKMLKAGKPITAERER